jgi:hypothetical protein
MDGKSPLSKTQIDPSNITQNMAYACTRLPVWFWTQLVTMFMVLGATLSTSWAMFTTFRSLQGFFGTVPQVVGLSIIHDMYELEDWAHMINIWYTDLTLAQ